MSSIRPPSPARRPASLAARLVSAPHALVNWGALFAALLLLVVLSTTLTPRTDDFKHYWQASIDLRRTGDPYAQRDPRGGPAIGPPVEIKRDDYIYPPALATLVQPLGLLPLQQAQLVWFWLNVALLGGLVACAIQVSGSATARRYWGVVALLVVFAPPTRICLLIGQLGILVGFLTVAGIALAQRHPHAAGAAFALGALLKIYPALTALAYLFRQRAVLLWTAVAGGLLLLLSLLVYGPAPYYFYLDRILVNNRMPYPLAAEANVSLAGLWQRMLTTSRYAIPLADAPLVATALGLLAAGVVLGWCAWISLRSTPTAHPALVPVIWLCATLLVWPASGYYNLLVLLLPLLVLVQETEVQSRRGERNWLLLGALLLCVPPGWSDGLPALYTALHTGWGLLALTPSLYGQMIILALLVVQARKTTHRTGAETLAERKIL